MPSSPAHTGSGGAFLQGVRSTINVFGALDWTQGHIQSWYNGKTADQNIKALKQEDAQARKDHPVAYYSGFATGLVVETAATMGAGSAFAGGRVAVEGAEIVEGASTARTALVVADASEVGVDAERVGAATRFGAGASSAGRTTGEITDLVLNPETGVWEVPQAGRSVVSSTSRELVHLKPPGLPSVIEGTAAEGETGGALVKSEISEIGQTAGRESSLGRFVKPALLTAGVVGGTALVMTMGNSGNPAQAQTQTPAGGTSTNGNNGGGSGGSTDGHNTTTSTVNNNGPLPRSPAILTVQGRQTPELFAKINSAMIKNNFGKIQSYDYDLTQGKNRPLDVDTIHVNMANGATMTVQNGHIEYKNGSNSFTYERDRSTGEWHDPSGVPISVTTSSILSAGISTYSAVTQAAFPPGQRQTYAAAPAQSTSAPVTPNNTTPPPPPPSERPGDRPRNTIHFGFNDASISSESAAILKTDAQYLNSHNITSTTIDAYTDEVGSSAYNQGLSQRRAQAVAAELKKDGYTGQVTTNAHGKNDPIVDTPNANAKNRRATVALSTP